MGKFNRDIELAKVRDELAKIKALQKKGFHQVVQPIHTIKFILDRKKPTI